MFGISSVHVVINCVCPLQGRSCALASFQAVPWIVPLASRLTPTTVRSVSAGRGPRSANPLYVTSTVPLDTCTYSHPESTLTATPVRMENVLKSRQISLCLLCGTAGGGVGKQKRCYRWGSAVFFKMDFDQQI